MYLNLKEIHAGTDSCLHSFQFLGSKVAQFWFSKSFFYVKNQPNLSKKKSLKNIKPKDLLIASFKCFLSFITIFKFQIFWIYTGVRPYLPGCQGQVTASDFLTYNNCNQCINTNFCDECQYWPIYPCYSLVRPMVDCVAEYVNDGISVNQVKKSFIKVVVSYLCVASNVR